MPAEEAPDLLTTNELAAYLRKPIATVRGWRYRKVGPTGFRLGRSVVYRRAVVDSWLAERERSAA